MLIDQPAGGIAHAKVIIIDGARVLAGSYNWTFAARRNSEDLLLLTGADIAIRYSAAWQARAAVSIPFGKQLR